MRRDKGTVYGPRILVLTPTRELAMQVAKAAATYGRHVQGLRVATVVGGVPYPAQIKALRGPLDILISTPGRLLDHLQTGKAVLDNVEVLVLDEADRMLDLGFIDDITTIADHLPATRQTMMYSATFVGHVGRLAQNLLRDPKRIDVASHTDTHENIEQRLHWADNGAHKNALLDHLLTQREMEQALVFTSTQRDADWLADRLADMGHAVASLHGGMPQGRRNRVLQGLRSTPAAGAGRDRRRRARHRRADHQPRHQLRPADEAGRLRPPHRPHRPRRPQRPGRHARRAHGQRHDPPDPAVHDADRSGRDDRRPGAEESGAAHQRATGITRRPVGHAPATGKKPFARRDEASRNAPRRRFAPRRSPAPIRRSGLPVRPDRSAPPRRPIRHQAEGPRQPRQPHARAASSRPDRVPAASAADAQRRGTRHLTDMPR